MNVDIVNYRLHRMIDQLHSFNMLENRRHCIFSSRMFRISEYALSTCVSCYTILTVPSVWVGIAPCLLLATFNAF